MPDIFHKLKWTINHNCLCILNEKEKKLDNDVINAKDEINDYNNENEDTNIYRNDCNNNCIRIISSSNNGNVDNSDAKIILITIILIITMLIALMRET